MIFLFLKYRFLIEANSQFGCLFVIIKIMILMEVPTDPAEIATGDLDFPPFSLSLSRDRSCDELAFLGKSFFSNAIGLM